MGPTIYELQEKKVVGIGGIGKPANPTDVWPALFARIQEIPGQVSKTETLGVIKRNEHGYLAGVQVDEWSEPPEGMYSYEIPAGRFAGMTHKGPVSRINETFEMIVNWLSANHHETWDIICFEVYDDRYKGEAEESEFDIYVQLKS
ncbi:GyrI-like domain-containing protein [Paenibacillus sp. XY044]|uniref:GyrI-like domain-containing protein n=1 Tax=Paenibacillus sp. XY044 TaxID=2026089 RepID=UPI000B994F75|nr:GyrI-like domain-containing protein [Paenibacillus sp. XY044]OZB96199.1 GyrI-like domain-containing protein [Paenibacillus sp. XY044]